MILAKIYSNSNINMAFESECQYDSCKQYDKVWNSYLHDTFSSIFWMGKSACWGCPVYGGGGPILPPIRHGGFAILILIKVCSNSNFICN